MRADHFIPTDDQLWGLMTVFVIALAFIWIGRIARGRGGLEEADILGGWAIGAIIISAGDILLGLPLGWGLIAVLASAIIASVLLSRARCSLLPVGIIRALTISLPLVLLVTAMVPSQWDEFATWLPNARYLVEFDHFPRTGGPTPPSFLPAYPHGLSLVIYGASRIAGTLIENAGALFNLILLLAFAALIARLVRHGATDDTGPAEMEGTRPAWAACALGILLLTVFGPTFVSKIVFTAYADAATALAVGFAGILGWMMLDALAAGKQHRAQTLAWQLGLVLAVLINLKQANMPLMVLLVLGVLLVAARDPNVRLGRAVRLIGLALIMPAILYGLWRYHVATHLTAGELAIRPVSEWAFHILPDIIARMALIASKKGGHFGLMLILAAFAVRGFIRMRTPFDRLAVIATVALVGYNLFLLFTYLTAFGEGEARRAASYWRYNMHLGALAMATAAYGFATLWRQKQWKLPPQAGWAVIALMVIIPIAASGKLRFDRHPAKLYVRAVGDELRDLLPKGARLNMLDPVNDGTYMMIVRYAINQHANGSTFIVGAQTAKSSDIAGALVRHRNSHAWVHESNEAVEGALNLALPAGASHLVRKEDRGWKLVKSWPYPGYARPADLHD